MSRAARGRKQTAAVVKLDGDLTIYAAASVQPQLLAALSEGRPIALDLGEVTEFDSAGAQQVLALARECEALGRPLQVVAASDCVREVFTLFALDARLALPAAAI
ncbi:MAG: lipid asymmetry maintenance protein MlaB [Gammaproteobacteria bacterium]